MDGHGGDKFRRSTNELRPGRMRPGASLSPEMSALRTSFEALDAAVLQWMNTRAAWDERKHATVLQFLVDIRQEAASFYDPKTLSVVTINLQLDRLSKKIQDGTIDDRIADFRDNLAHVVAPRAR